MNEERQPGDGHVYLQVARTLIEYRRRKSQLHRAEWAIVSASIDAVDVPQPWKMLEYEPDPWRIRQRRLTARHYAKLKRRLVEQVARLGAEAFDDESTYRLAVLTTTLQFGMWINDKSKSVLQQAIDKNTCAEQDLYRALCSLGGRVTADGELFAFPVGRAAGVMLASLFTLTLVVLVVCAAAFAVELATGVCRQCVLVGATAMFVLTFQAASILHQLGLRRAQCAALLMRAGVSSYASRPSPQPSDFMKFFRWGAPRYISSRGAFQ